MTPQRSITRLDALTYQQILTTDPVILIPVGSIEQHGPHMPLGVDTLLSTRIAELTAESIGAYVGPPVSAGYKSQQRSGGGNHIIGSFGFDAHIVIGLCQTLVRELARHGARRIVLVNGHYENYQFLYEGVDLALRELSDRDAPPPRVMLLSYWDFVTREVIDQLYPEGFPGWEVEHGGVMETSLMLEHFPDLVDMDRVMDLPAAVMPPYDLLPVDPSLTPESGCLSSAGRASAHKGRILTGSVVEEMGRAILSRFP